LRNEKSGAPIRASVYAPERVSLSEWRCRFVIRGLRGQCDEHAVVCRLVQALLQAFQGIRFYLEKSGLPISWYGEIGFGIYKELAGFDAKMTRHLERLVLRETTRLVRKRVRRRLTGSPSRKNTK
jgi:hypothetical protein